MANNTSPRKKWRGRVLWTVVVIVLAVVLMIALSQRVDPDTERVKALLRAQPGMDVAVREQGLFEMGPAAYPALAKLVGYHETPMHTWYRQRWPRLPAALKRYLPDPVEKRALHIQALARVAGMGPVMVRPMTSALCQAQEDGDLITFAMGLSALYWSIPDSPKAVARVEEWLADPSRVVITFGPQPLDEQFWSRMPPQPSLHIPWLRNPLGVGQATAALGVMGTNAAPAIPALLEVCEKGMASPPVMQSANPFGGSNILVSLTNVAVLNSVTPNRTRACETLGRIGIATPAVLAELNRGLGDPNPGIRFACLKSLHALHQPIEPALSNYLASVRKAGVSDKLAVIQWLGTLENEGRAALPWLRECAGAAASAAAPETAAIGVPVVQQERMRLAAMISLCRLEPEETALFVPDLVAAAARQPDPMELISPYSAPLADLNPRLELVNLVSAAKSPASATVAKLEPMLQSREPVRGSVAAYIILGLAPEHTEALATLQNRWEESPLGERIQAATWCWRRTGEYKLLIALCREGMETGQGMVSLNALGEIAPKVPAALPMIKGALRSPNQGMRNRAGLILMKIAPAELPPVQ